MLICSYVHLSPVPVLSFHITSDSMKSKWVAAEDCRSVFGHRTVALFRGATDSDAVSTEGRYGADIEAATGAVYNYWKSDDSVLNWAYSTGESDSAVGEESCEGPQPANYSDHNVDYVPDRYSYPEPDDGCMAEFVGDF